MLIGDPRDGFFYPTRTRMIDSYSPIFRQQLKNIKVSKKQKVCQTRKQKRIKESQKEESLITEGERDI